MPEQSSSTCQRPGEDIALLRLTLKKGENDKLQEKIEQSETKKTELQKVHAINKDKLLIQIEESEEENKKLIGDIKKLEKTIEAHQESVKKLNDKVEKIFNESQTNDDETKKLEGQVNDLLDEKHKLENVVEELDRDVKQKNGELHTRKQESELEKKKVEEEIRKNLETISLLEKTITESKEEVKKLKKECELGKKEQQERIEEQKAAINSLEERVEDLDEKIKIPQNIPQYETKQCMEMFNFEVDARGCSVKTPYCKLHIPPDSTKQTVNIRMKPEYNIPEYFENHIFISPKVTFETNVKDFQFEKNITISLHTSYTPIVRGNKIPVDVFWKENSNRRFRSLCEVEHGDERFITFTTNHFSTYGAVVQRSQYQRMQRYYRSAAYVRVSGTVKTRFFHWMVYEDCPFSVKKTIRNCRIISV